MKKLIGIFIFTLALSLIVTSFFSFDMTPLKTLVRSFCDSRAIRENAELREQIAVLENEKANSEKNEQEINRLKKLLDIDYGKNYNKIYATVTGITCTNEFFITVDKGSENGIRKNTVATFGKSLVGRVYEVFPHSCRITPLCAPDNSVGASLCRTGDSGVTQGSVSGFFKNTVSFSLFNSQKCAVTGDYVLTSGLGTVFPQGLSLGKITSVQDEEGKKYTLSCDADIFSLRYVCLLTEVAG